MESCIEAQYKTVLKICLNNQIVRVQFIFDLCRRIIGNFKIKLHSMIPYIESQYRTFLKLQTGVDIICGF